MAARLELLEKLINRSSLSTKRATHTHVIKIGGRVLDDFEDDKESQFQKELEEALAEAEAKAEADKQRALSRLKNQLENEKKRALQAQKEHFEDVAKKVAEMRDRLEAERMAELKLNMEEERNEALRLQWEEALRQKTQAVKDACDALTKRLNQEHKLDKEMSIGQALRTAREGFKRRLEETIAETTRRCEELAAQEAARVAQLHSEEVQRHEIRYQELKNKYDAEHAHRQRVENDFNELQTDYQRFMDYTDGRYHSDYMMTLRRHGMKLSEKRLSDVSEYQEKEIKDILLPSLRRKKN